MSNTLPFPNIEAVQQEAAEWLAAIDRGLSEREKQELDTWLAQSVVHGETLVSFAASWDKMDMLSAVSKIVPLQDFVQQKSPERSSRSAPYWIGSGLVAALVLLAAFIGVPYLANDAPIQESRFNAVYQSNVGEQKSIQLPDGSLLKLNTDTEVHVDYVSTFRKLELVKGEAYFDVERNPDQPFVVVVGENSVTAVGTAFNVQRLNTKNFEVIVTEGIVRVDQSADESISVETQTTSLSVGERLKVVPDTEEKNVEKLNENAIKTDLAWHDGLIVFEGETLQEVVTEVSRYTSIELVIGDPSISQIEIGGFFKAGDTEQLLYALKQNFDIDYEQQGNTLRLYSSK